MSDDPRLTAFLDKAELHELAMRYARAIDRDDRELLLSVYHPDGIDEHGALFRGGPVAYADWVEPRLAGLEVTAHYIVNTSYSLHGDQAEGELYFIAYHRTLPPDSRDLLIGGRYLDQYERRGGPWKIRERTIAWDWVRRADTTDESMAYLRQLGVSGGRGDDLSYSALPRLARGVPGEALN
jgi:hypothetical protein